MRPQLATGTASTGDAYGEILHRAWKEASTSEDKTIVESVEDIIQQFIHQAIHAANPKYFNAVRTLLHPFHVTKRNTEIDAMLLRAYGPIIWRSLRCANGIVRSQAAGLFFDCFPLKNDEANASDIDDILQKQFEFFTALLKDADHRVRVVSVAGVCNVLNVYWEVLPSPVKHQVLTVLVGTLALDSSSAGVRLAVVNGLTQLLEQPLAHTTLKKMIPLLAQCIHDNSEQVRIGFVQLLCKVKTTRGISFYEIVPVEHLLYRLTEDKHKPAMCYAMAELLCDSLVPTDEEAVTAGSSLESEYIQRCLRLIKSDPVATECVYAHLHKQLSTKQVVNLAALLFSFACTFSVSEDENNARQANVAPAGKNTGKNKPSKRSRQQQQDELDDAVEGGDDIIDSPTRLVLMKVVFGLLQSIQGKLTSKSAKVQHIKHLHTCCCEAPHAATIQEVLLTRGSNDEHSLELMICLLRIQQFCAGLGDGNPNIKAVSIDLAERARSLIQCFANGYSNSSESPIDNKVVESLVATVFAVEQQSLLIESISYSLRHVTTDGSSAAAAAKPKAAKRGRETQSSSAANSNIVELRLEAAVELIAAIVEFDRAHATFSSSSSSATSSIMNWTLCEELLRPLQQLLVDVVSTRMLVSKQHTMTAQELAALGDERTAVLRSAHVLTSMYTITELHNSLANAQAGVDSQSADGNSNVAGVIALVSQQLTLVTDKLRHCAAQLAGSKDVAAYASEMCFDGMKLVSVVLSVLVDAMKIKLKLYVNTDSVAQLESFAEALFAFIREFKEAGSASASKKLLSSKSAKATFSALAAVIAGFSSLLVQSKDGNAESRSRVGLILLNCLRPLSAVIPVDNADVTNGEQPQLHWQKGTRQLIEKLLAQDDEVSETLPESCVGYTDLRQVLLLQC
jgi:hypothetical protein